MDWSKRAVTRVEARLGIEARAGVWPDVVPAVAQVLREGLDLPSGVTFLVGENGSGKSTLTEAVAEAFGLNPEGGTPNARHVTAHERSDLAGRIRLHRSPGGSRWGFFLRAETMHGFYSYLDDVDKENSRAPSPMHERSHGESFLELLHRSFTRDGFYVLDEPEAALSFSGSLQLLRVLHEITQQGRAQVLCATHSPLLAALPGATILQLDDDGFHHVEWADLELVGHWRSYLGDPQRYLRHLLTPE
ncbi:MAG TPA: AAA family ATPase [Actinomycetales bacterium]